MLRSKMPVRASQGGFVVCLLHPEPELEARHAKRHSGSSTDNQQVHKDILVISCQYAIIYNLTHVLVAY